MRITTIIFDLNKVLVTYEENELDDEYEKQLGVSQSTFWKTGTKIFHSKDISKCHIDEFFSEIFEELNIPASKLSIAKKLHEDGFSMVKGMEDMLQSLSNYKLLLLAGDGHEGLRFKVKNFNLKKYFKTIYATCSEEKSKKDPQIYRDLLNSENLQPEECLFIDDMQRHIDIANNLGMHTILFKDAEQLKKELEKKEIQLVPI